MCQGAKCVTHNGQAVTSEFVGVSWCESKAEWRMDIGKGGKKFWSYHGPGAEGELGAALAYNSKAIELYGPGARIN